MKLALIHANVINGKDDNILENATLVIRDKVIEQVGKENEVSIPRDYETCDVSGMFIMPGLIESHGHIIANGEADLDRVIIETPVAEMGMRVANYARSLLMAGYTSWRGCGDPGYLEVHLRNAITKGIVEGPRIFAAGNLVCRTGGHADDLKEWINVPPEHSPGHMVDGVDGVRKMVREHVKAGADLIKFAATGGINVEYSGPEVQEFSDEELQVLMAEAHRAGKLTTAHAMGKDGIKAALMAGVDCIEHGVFSDEETIKMMKDRDVHLVPTIGPLDDFIEHSVELGFPETILNTAIAIRPRWIESLKMASEAGIKLAPGMDAGTLYCVQGENAKELQAHVKIIGVTPMEAIISATRNASEIVGFSDKIGTLEVGKLADLIVVNGNPAEDISILQNKGKLLMILKEGKAVKNEL